MLAYIDPATGSMILQVILGGLAAAAVTLRIFWGRVKEFFGFHKADSTSARAQSTAAREHPE